MLRRSLWWGRPSVLGPTWVGALRSRTAVLATAALHPCGGRSRSKSEGTKTTAKQGADAAGQYGEELRQAAEVIRASGAVLIAAGAGMGVDSGLPDFRGPEGFWRAYPALERRGVSFEEMANPMWFSIDPRLAWGFYGHRLDMYRRTNPHLGYKLLKALVKAKDNNYFIYTSNVDGQFQKAGFDEHKIVECHGSLHHIQCSNSCCSDIWSVDGISVTVNESELTAKPPLPSCPKCQRLARPNVLMFGDAEWLAWRTREQQKRYEQWLDRVKANKTPIVVLEFGAGRSVPRVRWNSEFVVSIARKNPATLIRINMRESEVPHGDGISLPMPAALAMSSLHDLLATTTG